MSDDAFRSTKGRPMQSRCAYGQCRNDASPRRECDDCGETVCRVHYREDGRCSACEENTDE